MGTHNGQQNTQRDVSTMAYMIIDEPRGVKPGDLIKFKTSMKLYRCHRNDVYAGQDPIDPWGLTVEAEPDPWLSGQKTQDVEVSEFQFAIRKV